LANEMPKQVLEPSRDASTESLNGAGWSWFVGADVGERGGWVERAVVEKPVMQGSGHHTEIGSVDSHVSLRLLCESKKHRGEGLACQWRWLKVIVGEQKTWR
jgi:hypothetical protein